MSDISMNLERSIAAPPEAVWRVLTDLEAAPEILSGVARIERLAGVGYALVGVSEAGFITNGQPTAIAGATLWAARLSGKLNGDMKLHGPIGTRFHMP